MIRAGWCQQNSIAKMPGRKEITRRASRSRIGSLYGVARPQSHRPRLKRSTKPALSGVERTPTLIAAGTVGYGGSLSPSRRKLPAAEYLKRN